MVGIGNRIKQLREEKGLKQEELAKEMSVSPSAIGMYETNKREPNNELTVKLANYFNVSTDYLLGKCNNEKLEQSVALGFKDRLVLLRKELGLTQEEFAEKIGYTRTAVSAWEIGRNEPSNSDTLKIANFFGVTTDYLLGKTDVRDTGEQIDDVLNEAMIGMSKEEYNALTEVQKQQIKDFALFVKNQSKKENK